jgi:hypothetical protein
MERQCSRIALATSSVDSISSRARCSSDLGTVRSTAPHFIAYDLRLLAADHANVKSGRFGVACQGERWPDP